MSFEDFAAATTANFDRLFAKDGVFSKEDADEAAALLERTTGVDEAQAERIVNRWQTATGERPWLAAVAAAD